MSLLRVVARGATGQFRRGSVPSTLPHSRVAICSSRSTASSFLHTLDSRQQSERVCVAHTNALNSDGHRHTLVRRHTILSPPYQIAAFRQPSVELPSFSSDQMKKCFFSSAPQQELRNAVSNSNDRDLHADTSSSACPSPSDEKAEKSTVASFKPDALDETKPPKFTTIEKKDSPITKKAQDAVMWAIKSIINLLAKTPGVLWFYMTHPSEFRKKLIELKEMAIKEAHHYWMGSKLLAADIRTARHILGRTLRGSTLSRRERKQLLRTVTDVFRLVPMSIFVLVPFMELALPFALKVFPNMLPSTFQDSLKEEEKMKGELQMRISMASFFQDTLAELAKEQKKSATLRKADAADASDAESIEIEKEASAESFLEFLKKARTGERIPPNVIIKFAGYFSDNLTLDNMERMQLIPLCKYMGILPYGNDNLLRFQLRHKIRVLKDDDQRILWEGIDSLTKMELREACRERGMRSTGLSKEAYRKSLQEWLELSVKQNVPISLLIMSRTFYLHDEMISGEPQPDDGSKSVSGLADAMSGIDKDVLNEIVLEMATSKEKSSNADVMKIQLEVLEHHNELIKEEQEERDAAAKEKAEEERKRMEQKEIEGKEAVEKEKTDEQTIAAEKHLDGASSRVDFVDTNARSDVLVSDIITKQDSKKEEEEEDNEEQVELSAEEIEAISGLVSPDPLHREKEDLQRIKDKIQAENSSEIDSTESGGKDLQQEKDEASLGMISAISPDGPIYTFEAQQDAVQSIKDLDEINEITKEAKSVVSLKGDTGAKIVVENPDDDEEVAGDKKLQKAIDRLKSRVESMVGKIETHLSDVEVKIGNKFHLLDKDMDGVLTREEMAQVLQTVLKRELTLEEAMAIAQDMDTNEDGVFSLSELQEWADSNIIIKLAEDGREKDVDELITKRLEDFNSSNKRKLDEEAEEWRGI